ncbi:LOW QUALITY PROTEIN: receptor-type tyrosine-protein phosphatase N2 [Silurus meridionalis]|uniref:LOW QUALITY PROTEIN: receptor-type tyrosine-protein phosphatase N2 n=1 Tax=Silurus meridionalis TaxID=175797 RepID=UPI001EEA4AC5|nr:LOW QUALITY PROTEIN: receptor-type tyrosine-protein phosphatase N2 [Silurus meridionalis]
MESSVPLRFTLLLLLLFRLNTASRKHGCLFEDDLCEPHEVCINDGVFGQCQLFPVSDLYKYEASPAALQRLRNLLQQLAQQGYTWQDEAMQQVVSRELQALPKTPVRRLGKNITPFKLRAQNSDGYNRKDLHDLGFLSADTTSFKHDLQGKYKFKGISDLMDLISEPKERPRPPPFASLLHPDRGPKNSFWTRVKPVTQTKIQDQNGLLFELQEYLSIPKEKGPHQEHIKYLGLQNSFLVKAGTGAGASRQPPQPRINKLLFWSGGSQPKSQDSLSSVDEKFIQGVVKQLGQQSVNTMTPSDFDQLSKVITQALQVVDDAEGVKSREVVDDAEMKREPGTWGRLGDKSGEKFMPKDVHQEGRGSTLDGEDKLFITQLLDFLDKNSSPEATDHPQDKTSLLGSSNLPQSPAGLKSSGVEFVQSRTIETNMDLTKKKMKPDTVEVQGDTEVEQWLRGEDALDAEAQKKETSEEEEDLEKEGGQVEKKFRVDVTAYSSERDGYFGYIVTQDSLSTDQGLNLMETLAKRAKLRVTDFLQLSVLGPAVTFRLKPNAGNITTGLLARVAVEQKGQLEKESGVKILEAGLSDRSKMNHIPMVKQSHLEPSNFLVLVLVSMAFVAVVLGLSGALFCMRRRSGYELKEKVVGMATDTGNDATATYQDLCRQRMAERSSDVFHHTTHTSRINSVSSQFSDGATQSPSARSSTSSWSEEPAHSNMDISTGHMILAYMEDHLQNQDRLEKEWEALCGYQAEPAACSAAQDKNNAKKNRPNSVLAYDHSRVTLKAENNQSRSDYINASLIMDHDPRNPAYISAQSPLSSTVPDFWQMVWESGCVVIVMLTPLSENGIKQCHQYWPDEGSDLYHIYEVNLVSEHIWCEDFLVRSFYLKNIQTNESRTVTQFHFLSWMDQNVPESARTLLDFRRKVNKCYRGRSCPIIIHCSDGSGRSGTYILIDMVLNKMAKGAKEIDIAATLEHLRDQRADMVHTKEQFEFALTAVAEEVNAILKALPQ